MDQNNTSPIRPRVVVIADVQSNATALVEKVLKPAGIEAWTESETAPDPDVLIVDVTQLMGDPLAGLRNRRSSGDDTPALILAARFPQSHLRDFFRLGVADVLMKPYRPDDLVQAINDMAETRSRERNTQILARKLETSRENIRQRSEEIRLLSEIGRTVVNLADLDHILTRVAEAAAFVTDAEEANIYLADPDTNELVLRASKQAGERNATLQRLRVNDTLVGQVFRTGQAMLRQPSLESGPVKIQTGFLVRSLINTPIRTQQMVIGVLGVYNRLASRPFTEHHLTLLSALADWAGVALEHAELIQQVQEPPSHAVEGVEKEAIIFPGRIDEAISRLDHLLNDNEIALDDPQIAALEGLKLSFMRGMTIVEPTQEELGTIDLPFIVEEAIEEWKDTANEFGLEIILGPSLPITPFPGNPHPVEQIVKNLIGSAINRTKEGRVVLNLHRFDVENGKADGMSPPDDFELQDGLWVGVTVADSSAGLTEEAIRALTSDDIDPNAGKFGPGLSMGEIRLISDSIGASIWHDQTPAGTTLIFALPVHMTG
jgi:DNA-binding NarL/FixJ family response regulator